MGAPTPTPKGGKMMLALVIAALVVSVGAIGFALVQAAAPARAPIVREFTIIMGEGEILTGINDTTGYAVPIGAPNADDETVAGEYHRWEPAVLVMFVGDTIRLTVKNPRSNDHSWSLTAQPGEFSGILSTGDILGKSNSGSPTGTQKVIEFTALKPGVYKFVCATPHDHLNDKCDEDHPTMVGYVVVLQ